MTNIKHIDLSISPSWERVVMENSYFSNFIYWRWFRVLSRMEGGSLWQSIKSDFDDETIRDIHHQELQGVAEYARQHHIALLVRIFPRLIAIPGSQRLTAKAAEAFLSSRSPVIDRSHRLAC